LLSQVFNYLVNVGMCGNLYVKTTYPEKNQQTQYRVQFNGKANLRTFKEQIGFVNEKHKNKYLQYNKSAGGVI